MARETRRIVIVGGVAGGASAATRARRCNEDAQIIMFEKGAHVSFANCGMPYYDGGEIANRESLLVAKPELLRKRFKIDVRTAKEWAGGHLANAVHIPVDELRERLGELDPQRETVTVCLSGKRAYVAARILAQHGFRSVADLTGGMLVRDLIDERASNNR